MQAQRSGCSPSRKFIGNFCAYTLQIESGKRKWTEKSANVILLKVWDVLYEKRVETRLRRAVGWIRNHSSYNLPSSSREHKCTRAFSLRVLHLKFLLHVFLLNFHATEDDSQPDCSRLLRQRSICHGELLLSVTLKADCG